MRTWALVLTILLSLTGNAHPQLTAAPQASVTVPHVIRYSGSVPLSVPAGQTELRVTFRLYSAARGGRALWQETQAITAQNGKIAALIGATAIGGIPDYGSPTAQPGGSRCSLKMRRFSVASNSPACRMR
jgi:hypothetical protein